MTQARGAMDADVAGRVAAVLKSLADPLRLRMLSLIATAPDGEVCVCDIATVADVSQPTVSHHLKVLKETGVLTSQRRGTWVYYRLVPDVVAPVLGLLGEVFGGQQLTDAAGATARDAADARTRVPHDA